MRTERIRDALQRLCAIAEGPRSRARAQDLAERFIKRFPAVERAGLLEHFNDAMKRAREPELNFGDRVDERALELMVDREMSPADALLEAEREAFDDERDEAGDAA